MLWASTCLTSCLIQFLVLFHSVLVRSWKPQALVSSLYLSHLWIASEQQLKSSVSRIIKTKLLLDNLILSSWFANYLKSLSCFLKNIYIFINAHSEAVLWKRLDESAERLNGSLDLFPLISPLLLADPHCSKGRHLVRSGEPLHPE